MAMQIEQHIVKTENFQHSQWKSMLTEAPHKSAIMDHPKEGYSIVPLTTEDGPRMLEFLKRFFFRDEPLNINVQLLGEAGTDQCLELEEFCMESLSEPLSLMAISNSGELIGVCLNGSHEPGHLEEAEAKAEECPNRKFRKILKLLAAVERRADVFGQFPDIKQLLEVRVLSVDGSWRGRGIATALIDRTRELARQKGFPMVRVDCTSHYSARAVSRLGFSCIFEMPYDQYTEDGRPVLSPELPHLAVTTYVQRI